MDAAQVVVQMPVANSRANAQPATTGMALSTEPSQTSESFAAVMQGKAVEQKSDNLVVGEVRAKMSTTTEEQVEAAEPPEAAASKNDALDSALAELLLSSTASSSNAAMEKVLAELAQGNNINMQMLQNVAAPLDSTQQITVQSMEGRTPEAAIDEIGRIGQSESMAGLSALTEAKPAIKNEPVVPAEGRMVAMQSLSENPTAKDAVELDRLTELSAETKRAEVSGQFAGTAQLEVLQDKVVAGALQVVPAGEDKQPSAVKGDNGNTVAVVQNADSLPDSTMLAEAAQVPLQTKPQTVNKAADFKFAETPSVEIAANSQQQNVPAEDVAAISPADAKARDAAKTIGSGQDMSSPSDSNGENDANLASRQHADIVKPAENQLAGLQQKVADVPPFEQATSDKTEGVGSISSEKVAGQVKDQLANRELKPGSEQITIKLSPEHLGDIKVNFRMDEQRLKVEIVAENRTARECLLQHADSLKESLARQNITMEKFDVTNGSGSYNGQGGHSQHGEWQELAKNRQAQQWMNVGGYRQQYAAETSSLPVYFAKAEHSTLDLRF